MRVISCGEIKLAREVGVGCLVTLAIYSYYLLPGGVSHACEDAGLGHRGVRLIFQDAADRNFLMAEISQQESASFVVAHDPDREDVHPEIGEIVGGIGS